MKLNVVCPHLPKIHYGADAKSRIITDCYTATGSAHEGPLLPE